jgi:hypothetical protein
MKSSNDNKEACLGCLVIGMIILSVFAYIFFFCDSDRLKVSSSLDVVDKPSDYCPGSGKVSFCDVEGLRGFGTDKVLLVTDVQEGRYSLKVFSRKSTIADVSWLVT